MMLIGKHVEIRVCVCDDVCSRKHTLCGGRVWTVDAECTESIDVWNWLSRVHQPTIVNMNSQSVFFFALKRKAHSPKPRNTTVNRVSAVIFRKQTINKWRWLLKYASCFAANALWLADNMHSWLDTRTDTHGLRVIDTDFKLQTEWSEVKLDIAERDCYVPIQFY